MSTQQLSAKELKEKKKAEKRAKRAAQKGTVDGGAGVTPAGGANAGLAGSAGTANAAGPAGGTASVMSGPSGAAVTSANLHSMPSPSSNYSHLFSHLEVPRFAQLMSSPDPVMLKEIHPAVLQLATQIASHKIIGSTARARAMLCAFRLFIMDYSGTPQGVSFSRHMTQLLSTQIDFLKNARPLSVSMGNCIRWLKKAITTEVEVDWTDEKAKDELQRQIAQFIRERIDVAGQVISMSVSQVLNDHDVILTYGHSQVVVNSLIFARTSEGKKKNFRVIVVDSQPLFEGKKTVRALTNAGISCTYVPLSALIYALQDVTQVFLGAHAVFSNGRLFSRVGTAAVATAATSRNVPVIVLCETIKFSNKVQLDAVTYNELGADVAGSFEKGKDASDDTSSKKKKDSKDTFSSSSSDKNVMTLNILFDLTPQNAIKKVITEVGSLPASSVPVILREYRV